MKFKINKILLVIILIALAFRLYFAFASENFSSDESYFHYRIINYIKENKLPMLYDELSYGGQKIFYPQLFHVILAILSFIPYSLKIIPALISVSLIIIVYLLAKKITNDNSSSLLTAFLVSFIPIEIKNTINQLSIYSFIIIIMLILYLCLMNLENKKYFNFFLILSFLISFIHPISLLFAFSLIFYLILANTESLYISKYRKEAIVFSFFLILLVSFLLYKDLFLQYGFSIIWQNVPDSLFQVYFKNINALDALYLIGLPLILGSLGIFFGMYKEKQDSIILLTAAILTTLLSLLIKALTLEIGILLLGIFLAIPSSLAISKIYSYISITKFSNLRKYITIFLIILIMGVSITPSYFAAKSLPNYNQEIKTFQWIKENTEKNAVVLAPLETGNILTSVSGRKNVMDSNFLLSRNTEERYDDISRAYNTFSKIFALESLRKYDARYIYLGEYVKGKYNLTNLRYADNEECFKEIKNDVYKVIC